ncbi:unnamed protein product [Cyprideis torosa]|uniref:medium-chain acyl-CoA ligase n=1 Tax=Cyprideis torosa TaxID=163714 RepID=A0A7R8WA35_9CRUS|nr:unnamed protein product [Cyprideis torosa]CAG0890479.1 unnamed protein product [Cyprideis torosa]
MYTPAGAILIPGTVQLTAKDIARRIHVSRCTAIICDEDTVGKVDSALETLENHQLEHKVLVHSATPRQGWHLLTEDIKDVVPRDYSHRTAFSDPAQMFFTSGTTGDPKVVVHTHGSYGMGHWTTGKLWLDLRPREILLNLADTGWAKAAYSSMFGVWMAGSCIFVDGSLRFDPLHVLSILRDFPISVLCAPPTTIGAMIHSLREERLVEIDRMFLFQWLRHCVAAGEALNPELLKAWKEITGLSFREGYGQTETTLVAATLPDMDAKPGALGKDVLGYSVAILNSREEEVQTYEEGEIACRVHPHRPIGLFAGYLDQVDKTQQCFTKDQKYYLTGDKGFKDEDGYINFVSRKDDVIISAGYRIGPFEVESALLEHPAVAEAAAVGLPDAHRGQIVTGFVVLKPPYFDSPEGKLTRELQEHVKKITAPYKYPRRKNFIKANAFRRFADGHFFDNDTPDDERIADERFGDPFGDPFFHHGRGGFPSGDIFEEMDRSLGDFRRMMDGLTRSFGMFDPFRPSIQPDRSGSRPELPPGTIIIGPDMPPPASTPMDPSGTLSPRDRMLKSPAEKQGKSVLPPMDRLPASDQAPGADSDLDALNPEMQPQQTIPGVGKGFFKSVTIRRYRDSNGTFKEEKITRNSDGTEERVITEGTEPGTTNPPPPFALDPPQEQNPVLRDGDIARIFRKFFNRQPEGGRH